MDEIFLGRTVIKIIQPDHVPASFKPRALPASLSMGTKSSPTVTGTSTVIGGKHSKGKGQSTSAVTPQVCLNLKETTLPNTNIWAVRDAVQKAKTSTKKQHNLNPDNENPMVSSDSSSDAGSDPSSESSKTSREDTIQVTEAQKKSSGAYDKFTIVTRKQKKTTSKVSRGKYIKP